MSNNTTDIGEHLRSKLGSDLNKHREEIQQRRQSLVEKVRALGVIGDRKFDRREDRIWVAQEIDRLVTNGSVKPRQIREVCEKRHYPKLHLERLSLDHTLSPAEARKIGSKNLSLKIKPYLELLDALSEILGRKPDDLIYGAFKETSSARTDTIVENDLAVDLNFLLHELIKGVVKVERLEQYFQVAQRIPASFDPETREFSTGDVPSVGWIIMDGFSQGYENSYEFSTRLHPLPAVPLLRIPRTQFSGPLTYEKEPLAPKSRSASDVARLLKAMRKKRDAGGATEGGLSPLE